ncbi:NAD-dependent epimerase/dehydratase family protein [Cryobacterium sp. SO2]|uniref:NAD-dependent epimerase/dehydratase family protein n=1 Tax=Cryobacterium sp. SO2 TaxID=1897060 RepID=UPI00223E0ACE|nr:NAD-dependent epimerase/dehydratase family protein [Cryobacterium sp. SO2]WEO76160.1 NAD-dependent epimerase/dehydratase family protein [Cryobacterium sp. SO2]
MTILITGGAGFIGTALTRALLEDTDEDIVVLDNLHPQVHGEHPILPALFDRPRVNFVRADVTDPLAWDALLAQTRPRIVVHLAAETGTGQSLLQASRHTHVNVNGTAVMLDALARADRIPQRIILTSSRAVYGEGRWRDLTTGEYFYPAPRGAAQLASGLWDAIAPSGGGVEFTAHEASQVEPRPSNVYAATKLAQEHILLSWCAALTVDLTVLRLQNVYGAGQAVGNPYTGVLTYFARELNSARPISVFEGGGIARDFVHVSDVVRAIEAALSAPVGAAGHRTFDIGAGASGTLAHFATVLAGHVGAAEPDITRDYRLGDVRAAYADIKAARDGLGYEPRITFEEGSRELLTWVAAELEEALSA